MALPQPTTAVDVNTLKAEKSCETAALSSCKGAAFTQISKELRIFIFRREKSCVFIFLKKLR